MRFLEKHVDFQKSLSRACRNAELAHWKTRWAGRHTWLGPPKESHIFSIDQTTTIKDTKPISTCSQKSAPKWQYSTKRPRLWRILWFHRAFTLTTQTWKSSRFSANLRIARSRTTSTPKLWWRNKRWRIRIVISTPPGRFFSENTSL